jgi:cation transport ATPase
MKRSFSIENLDCASCASKMEDAVKKISGVTAASVNFITSRLVIEAEDPALFEEIVSKAVKACKKIEPDCVINI